MTIIQRVVLATATIFEQQLKYASVPDFVLSMAADKSGLTIEECRSIRDQIQSEKMLRSYWWKHPNGTEGDNLR